MCFKQQVFAVSIHESESFNKAAKQSRRLPTCPDANIWWSLQVFTSPAHIDMSPKPIAGSLHTTASDLQVMAGRKVSPAGNSRQTSKRARHSQTRLTFVLSMLAPRYLLHPATSRRSHVVVALQLPPAGVSHMCNATHQAHFAICTPHVQLLHCASNLSMGSRVSWQLH